MFLKKTHLETSNKNGLDLYIFLYGLYGDNCTNIRLGRTNIIFILAKTIGV